MPFSWRETAPATITQTVMPPRHIALALVTTMIWGVSFVAIRLGLNEAPPLLLCALRFAFAGLPVLALGFKPPAGWRSIVAVGLFIGVGQFGLLFLGMADGMPPGLSSLVIQSQVFFTIGLGALWLGERPSARQLIGVALAGSGLILIGREYSAGHAPIGFALVVLAAISWALGNIAIKKSGAKDMMRLMVWKSLVAPLPLLALSLMVEGPGTVSHALATMDWLGYGTAAFLGLVATVIGFGAWGFLLRQHSAAQVTPFALLVPIFGYASSAVVFGEALSQTKLIAAVLVLSGLAVTVLRRQSTTVARPA